MESGANEGEVEAPDEHEVHTSRDGRTTEVTPEVGEIDRGMCREPERQG